MILAFDQVPAVTPELPWYLWLVVVGLLVVAFCFLGRFLDDLGR